MLDDLRQYIKQYDKVIWIEKTTDIFDDFLKSFCESRVVKNFQGKIIILSMKKPVFLGETISCRKLNIKEQKEIRDYYMMYDFSNRFQLISDSSQYGGLLNYVKTGILTMEEVFQALLA